MLFDVSFEKSLRKIPVHMRALLIPEFVPSYKKIDQGELLSQYLNAENFEVWKYDLNLDEEASTGINTGTDSYPCIFWVKTGGVNIQARKGETNLFECCSVILNPRFCVVNLSKGISSFWITRFKTSQSEISADLMCRSQNQVVLIDPLDIKVLDNLFVKPIKFLKDMPVRELRLQYLISRLLEELEVRERNTEYLISSQMEAVKLRTYLEDNYGNIISLGKLKVPATVRKYFKQLFKIEPSGYLQDVRILHARKLLRDTDLPVHQIAWEVGYESAAGFTRVFSARTRQSPIHFRREVRQMKRKNNLSSENIF